MASSVAVGGSTASVFVEGEEGGTVASVTTPVPSVATVSATVVAAAGAGVRDSMVEEGGEGAMVRVLVPVGEREEAGSRSDKGEGEATGAAIAAT
jgi:hypothetical protein